MEDDIVLQVIILVFMLLFAIATFVVANEKNDEPASPQCNCSQEHGHFFKYKGGDVDDQL